MPSFHPNKSRRLHVAEIHIFPVKAFAGTSVAAADCEPCGLHLDRRWMVVDSKNRFLTQRVLPQMAVITPRVTPRGLQLLAPGRATVDVGEPGPDQAPEPVVIWRDTVPAVPADGPVNAWISAALGQPCRLVHLRDPGARVSSSKFALPGETVTFADGFPVLLTSTGSLAELNARLASPVPISRFRANLVIGGAPAWAEDSWRVIRLGCAVFRVAKPCDRCLVTTIDQETGERPQRMEPLRTLGQFRQEEHGIMFGQNLVPIVLGRVAVGDRVEVLESGAPNVNPL